MGSATLVAVTLATTKPDAVRVPDADTVSPGFAGFVAIFCLAVATVLIIRAMTRSMRRVKFKADEEARAEAASASPSAEASQAPEASSPVSGTVQTPSQG